MKNKCAITIMIHMMDTCMDRPGISLVTRLGQWFCQPINIYGMCVVKST